MHNMPSPCEAPVFVLAAVGAKKLYSKAPNRKHHFTFHLLKTLCNSLDKTKLINLQLATYAAIAFFGFFRYSDLARITIGDVVFAGDHM